MFNSILKIWKPAIFQGNLKDRNYFEGWYFKVCDAEANHVYAVIPGISLRKNNDSHAFIQVMNGSTSETRYISYDLDQVEFSEREMEFRIGQNRFSEHGMNLNIDTGGIKIDGEIAFGKFSPWPVKLFSPGVMGWYAFVPFMECYHGIVSFEHKLHGHLRINGETINFSGGKGYIEKDWGTSFPRYYIWVHSNHFDHPDISLMASVANIPWLGSSFDGFIFGFYYQGIVYRFTTYNGAKITKLYHTDKHVQVCVADKNHLLEIEAIRHDGGGELRAPKAGEMADRIRESMNSVVHVKLKDIKKNMALIFSGRGTHAGLEMGGQLDKLKEI